MARRLAEELGVPVVCSLSGEDSFLEGIPEPHYSEARAVLRARCGELSALVAMSGYYADFMAEYLSVPRERIHVIPPGLNLVGHGARREPEAPGARPVTIGYLSRIAPEKGLHHLAEAFKLLAERDGLPPTRLVAAGYLNPVDRPYLDRIRSQLAAWGLADRFEYAGELDLAEKIAFLQSLDVFSVPTLLAESKGLALLEAWANAVPAVVPDHGAFGELVADTGGGLLHAPENPAELAAALARMILDRPFAVACGRRAQEAVRARYDSARTARETLALYRALAAGGA
jgi:glycosyltransferase involved in cell wall biosynthesis